MLSHFGKFGTGRQENKWPSVYQYIGGEMLGEQM